MAGFYVFNTEAEANSAIATVNAAIRDAAIASGWPPAEGFISRGTITWDIPRQRLDGKWIFAEPPEPYRIAGVAVQNYSADWFPAPVMPEPVPPTPEELERQRIANGPKVTPTEWVNRFTETEQAGIVALSATELPLRTWLFKLPTLPAVHLLDPRLDAMLNLFVANGIITEARKAEVLA